MKNENKTIKGLVKALETMRYFKGDAEELLKVEPVLQSVTTIVEGFNKLHDIDPAIEEIKEWAKNEKELQDLGARGMKAMAEDPDKLL